MLHADALRLAQQRRPPVEDRKADDINEEIGKAQNPDQRVLEDVLHQERTVLGAFGGFLLLPDLGALQFGKPHRRGRVAQEDDKPDSACERNGGRNPETPFPRPGMGGGRHDAPHARGVTGLYAQIGGHGRHGVGIGRDVHTQRTHDISAEDHDQTGPDRVRGIPHRHLRRQLRGRNPVGQQAGAGRESRSLQHAVYHPHDTHEENHRIGELRTVVLARDPVGDVFAESEGEVGQCAERKSDSHVPAGVHPVGQNAVHETRKSVDHAVQGQENSQTGFRDPQIGLKAGHGQRKVFTHEVKERVTDHRGDDRTGLPVLEALGLFRSHFGMKV